MSLINDALKRAEQEKRANTTSPLDDGLIVPASIDYGHSPTGLRIFLLVGAFVVVGVATWFFVSTTFRPLAPDRAAAKLPPTLIRRGLERGEGVGDIYDQTGPPRRFSPAVEETFAKTLEGLKYYEPPMDEGMLEAVAEEAGLPPAISGREPRPGDPEFPAAAAAAAAVSQPATTTAPTTTQAAPPPPSFKLSAVLRGSGGVTAIVNGRFVQVGSTIQGAKVISIDRHSVQLELDGETITIQM